MNHTYNNYTLSGISLSICIKAIITKKRQIMYFFKKIIIIGLMANFKTSGNLFFCQAHTSSPKFSLGVSWQGRIKPDNMCILSGNKGYNQEGFDQGQSLERQI